MAETKQKKDAASGPKPLKLLLNVLLLFVIIALAVAVGSHLGGTVRPQTASAEPPAAPASEGPAMPDEPPSPGEECSYYKLEPLTVTPNTKNMNRFLRAALVFKTRPKDLQDVSERVMKYGPDLTSRLTTYLADLTLDQTRSERNLNRLRREIRDLVNEVLWPEQRPRVVEVLFAEFYVQ